MNIYIYIYIYIYMYIYIRIYIHRYLHTHTHTYIYIYIYCYAAMCPAGLKGAVRSRQVHLLTQGTDVGCGLPNAI